MLSLYPHGRAENALLDLLLREEGLSFKLLRRLVYRCDRRGGAAKQIPRGNSRCKICSAV